MEVAHQPIGASELLDSYSRCCRSLVLTGHDPGGRDLYGTASASERAVTQAWNAGGARRHHRLPERDMLRRICWVVAGGLVLSSCGTGGNPAGPSTQAPPPPVALPAGATLTFVSGDSQQAAAAARVNVGNVAYATDGAGRITLGQPAEMGAHVTVEAGGFLKRETLIRNSVDTVFTLWPLEDAFGVYTRTLVYGSVGPPLQRFAPSTRRVSIVPNQEFLTADPDGLEAHEYVAERMTAATGGQIEFVVEEHPSGDVVVSSELLPDPCDAFSVACAETKEDGNHIVGGRIMISSLRTIGDRRAVILHEMGHIYGLLHSPSSAREDVMSVVPTAVTDFSPSELRTMRMMLQRLAGTVFPDDDTHVGSSVASSGSTEVIVCGP